MPPKGSVELAVRRRLGRTNEAVAAQKIEKHLSAKLPAEALAATFALHRALAPAIVPVLPRFAFSEDGRELQTAPAAPRPFSHVMAGPRGLGAVATHDGDIFAFHRNARANSLTPFRMGEGRNAPPGQAIYVVEKDSGEVHAATLLPLRRPDTHYDAVFGRGVVTFASESPSLALEQKLFVAPDEPVEILLLTLRNLTDREQIYRIAPGARNHARRNAAGFGRTRWRRRRMTADARFISPIRAMNSCATWAFVSTSLDADCCDFSRAKILGRKKAGADPRVPFLALHGHADPAPRTMAAAPPVFPA